MRKYSNTIIVLTLYIGVVVLPFINGCQEENSYDKSYSGDIEDQSESPGPQYSVNQLDPAQTYAIIVGVLHWKGISTKAFFTKNRKDKELYNALIELKVPSGNIALLFGSKATHANILTSLKDIARKAKPGSTLIFYYQGRGVRESTSNFLFGNKANEYYFANYDIDWNKIGGTGLAHSQVKQVIEQHFHGNQILFLAECNYSGKLSSIAESLNQQGYCTASLTSVGDQEVSSENWTFTWAVVDGFKGNPLYDINDDGFISLSEISIEVEQAMKYIDGIKYGYSLYGMNPNFIIAPVKGKNIINNTITEEFSFKEYVLAPTTESTLEVGRIAHNNDINWRIGRIIGKQDEKCLLQFQGYNDRKISLVPVEDIKKIRFKTYSPGKKAKVLWKGKSYSAEILDVQGDFHKITYTGYTREWDEWVLSNRIFELPP